MFKPPRITLYCFIPHFLRHVYFIKKFKPPTSIDFGRLCLAQCAEPQGDPLYGRKAMSRRQSSSLLNACILFGLSAITSWSGKCRSNHRSLTYHLRLSIFQMWYAFWRWSLCCLCWDFYSDPHTFPLALQFCTVCWDDPALAQCAEPQGDLLYGRKAMFWLTCSCAW